MTINFPQRWQNIRSSLWFVPGLIVLAAVVAAMGLIEIDSHLDGELFKPWPRLFGAGAEGARGLLATVASSMITVAGTVFSITIVALSLASSQYTSRVLRNFMRDQVNQIVLGVFVGIFAYCLVVLRTIRGQDDGGFVPSLAVMGGLLLAFVGIAVLIYFIHHISTSIQAVHILSAVAEETMHAVEKLFPEGAGEENPRAEPEPEAADGSWQPVPSVATGYIQSVDTSGLLAFAEERQAVVRMERSVGEFVIEDIPWASVLAAEELTEDDFDRLKVLYAVGATQTVDQDAAFGLRQIVDVALKALSPGINDTTTAAMCIDYLAAILVKLTDRRIESNYRAENGTLRLIAQRPTYGSLVGESFDQIRQNSAGNVAVLAGLLNSIELLVRRTTSSARRKVLVDHGRVVWELAQNSIPFACDRQALKATADRIERQLRDAESH